MKALAIVAVALLAGCTDTPSAEPLPWHGRDLAAPGWQNFTLAGHSILEAEYALHAGDVIAFDWVVPSQWGLSFDIHRHAGDDVVTDRFFMGPQDAGRFTAPATALYYLAWTNQNVGELDLWVNVPPWQQASMASFDDGHEH